MVLFPRYHLLPMHAHVTGFGENYDHLQHYSFKLILFTLEMHQ
jgi:hypothetical protein